MTSYHSTADVQDSFPSSWFAGGSRLGGQSSVNLLLGNRFHGDGRSQFFPTFYTDVRESARHHQFSLYSAPFTSSFVLNEGNHIFSSQYHPQDMVEASHSQTVPILPQYLNHSRAVKSKAPTSTNVLPYKVSPNTRHKLPMHFPGNRPAMAVLQKPMVDSSYVTAATSLRTLSQQLPLQNTTEPSGLKEESEDSYKNDDTMAKRKGRKCKVERCSNTVVQGGLCISHGAKRKKCGHPAGCDKKVKKAGMCSAHGPARKKCQQPCCSKIAVQGGLCIAHGAKKRVCSFSGCDKKARALYNQMCKRHHDESGPQQKQQQGWNYDTTHVPFVSPRSMLGDASRSGQPQQCYPVANLEANR